MEVFDRVKARFVPTTMSTVRSEGIPFIGRVSTWEAYWLITEEDGGPYVGQWAMMSRELNDEGFPGWVPACDLELVPEKSPTLNDVAEELIQISQDFVRRMTEWKDIEKIRKMIGKDRKRLEELIRDMGEGK